MRASTAPPPKWEILFVHEPMINAARCRFTGVDSFNLCGDDGQWIESYDRDLFAYDAGTDSGVSFASENEETSPREPITPFSDVSPQSDSIFYNPDLCASPAHVVSCF